MINRNQQAVQWAPRVSPSKIRRLYASDARGLLDEDLLDDVYVSLLCRCESMQVIADAIRGTITCPVCTCRFKVDPRGGHLILFDGPQPRRLEVRGRQLQKEDEIACSECGWALTWGEYRATWDRKKLNMGGAGPAIEAFVSSAKRTLSPEAKMRVIDELIHAFHLDLDLKPVRPVACNVIDAKLPEIVELIQGLAYGDCTSKQEAPKWHNGWWNRSR